ncbi:MAG TPA: RsmE family RNA methyltransferase [Candidatus Sulfotelmatobacter sp.]|nr:RsmE family RNA methyltransferase [Candidatus Sulfotelmatobacter sp.]
MTRRRWIADEVSLDRAALTGEHADHLIRVLRARVGQEFDIATGSTVRRGRIVSIREQRVDFDLGEEISESSSSNVILLLAIFKFDRMEWAIEKSTELGVGKIFPLIARRTDAHLAAASQKRVERWRKIALQSAEQSRRAVAPELSAPIKLQDAVRIPAAERILLNELEQQNMLPQVLTTHPIEKDIAIAVGPEGGWTEHELEIFQTERWLSVSLGSTILRTETAAIASVAITMALSRFHG